MKKMNTTQWNDGEHMNRVCCTQQNWTFSNRNGQTNTKTFQLYFSVSLDVDYFLQDRNTTFESESTSHFGFVATNENIFGVFERKRRNEQMRNENETKIWKCRMKLCICICFGNAIVCSCIRRLWACIDCIHETCDIHKTESHLFLPQLRFIHSVYEESREWGKSKITRQQSVLLATL